MIWDEPINPSKLPAIIGLARDATLLRPHAAKNWLTLAQLLRRTHQMKEAIGVLVEAVSRLPAERTLHLTLADVYHQTGQVDLMNEVISRLPAGIDDQNAEIFRFEILMKAQSAENVVQIAAEVLKIDPTNARALEVFGNVSRKKGTPEIMIPICTAALKHNRVHTQARYELAVAFAMLGRSEEARKLIDLHQFVHMIEVPTPTSYSHAKAFEVALANEITNNPTLKPDPIDKATKGGFQTLGGLPHAGELAISALVDQIRLSVDAFEAKIAEGLENHLSDGKPKRVRLDAWAVIYPGDGRQVSHIHPDGWLSGVYYVSVPQVDRSNLRSGCLVLGSLEIKELAEPPWGIRDIVPVPRRLILFPSYIPHATIPSRSNENRICIAFDVIPVRL
jgi:hypothetical protein